MYVSELQTIKDTILRELPLVLLIHAVICVSPLLWDLQAVGQGGSFPGQQSTPTATGSDHLCLTARSGLATRSARKVL